MAFTNIPPRGGGGKITHFEASKIIPGSNEFLEVLTIDSSGRLWAAFPSHVAVAEIDTKQQVRIVKTIPLKNARVIKESPQGDIWIGSWDGLHKITRDFALTKIQNTESINIPDICFLRNGKILFSEHGIGIYELDKDSLVPAPFNLHMSNGEYFNKVVNIFEDSQQRLWLGSYAEGLLCVHKDNYVHMTTEDGLPSNSILCFEEDRQGDVWASTLHGICRIRNDNHDFFISNYCGSILPGHQYHEKSGTKTGDGLIFFGGNHGLTFFNPSNFSAKSTPPAIHVESLKIYNKTVKFSKDKKSLLKKSLLFTDEITVSHKQNMITLDYAGIDFSSSNNLTYKYKLEGFDKDWNYVGTHRRVSFSNLVPKKYTFLVSAINDDGVESSTPAILKISVMPSPWLTWQALSIYCLLLMGIAFYVTKAIFNYRMNEQRVEIERKEHEREREIAKMKITFFTNISHELRTPLTLINAPLELIAQKQSDPAISRLAEVALNNTRRLLQLIGQLMDSVKIENGVLSLSVKKQDIIGIIRHVCDSFKYTSEQRNIELSFTPHAQYMEIWADEDKLEKILYNILSNAVKHTPSEGHINISTGISGDMIVISVRDSGTGVQEDMLDRIFDRYKTINNSPDYSGTGIGLHYTKTLVEKHKGSIKAELCPEGGMIFSVSLPTGDVYSEDEKQSDDTSVQFKDNDLLVTQTLPSAKKAAAENNTKILIIEDNDDLRGFMETLLSDIYQTTCVPNAEEALNIPGLFSYDLIISDVIMPGISGFDFCATMKENPESSHIPIILLTAKTTINDQIEGLENGADAYICKPFNVDHLFLTIKNLLNRKEILRKYFSEPSHAVSVNTSLNKQDQVFLEKLTALITEELYNPELNINTIARQMGYSRTILYRKIKGLTNMSPNDFVRNFRFKRSAELIIEGTMSLAEIAEQTGFNSYSYFSKSFKAHYGFTPKEYQTNHTKLSHS